MKATRRPRLRRAALAALWLACGGPEAERAASAPGADPPAAAGEAGALGEGFLVWESNRSGSWRIWRRPLAADRPEQLTRDEPGRQHCCPHLSPDGTRLVYLSLAAGGGEYPGPQDTGELRLLALASGEEQVLAPAARTYLEDRAAVWHGDGAVAFIDAEGATVRLELASGRRERLTAGGRAEYGWLVDAGGRWATLGWPTFSPYEPGRRAVAERASLGGCQPYFSRDGRWGFWTAGAGGPLNRIELATGAIGTIIGKSDPRLPAGLGYLYFPMLSVDGRLFAFGASRGQHSHHTSDYEIFVAEADPATLELVGEPVRMTEHPATDRFPDVWAPPLPLGSWHGEAPFAATLEAPGEGSWQWSFGDGGSGAGARVEHVWERPGRYVIEARRGGEALAGRAVVVPAAPPHVLATRLTGNGARIEVSFDEPVRLQDPAFALASGNAVLSHSLSADGRILQLERAEPLRGPDRLTLAGIVDLAGRPNALPETTIDLEPPLWPSSREGLLFAWQTGEAANLVFDDALGAERTVALEPEGAAHLDHDFALVVDGGSFAAPAEEGGRLRLGLQATNALTLEAVVRPAAAEQEGRILAFAGGGAQNFELRQRGSRLLFSLRIGSPRRPDPDAGVELASLPAGRATHVALTYAPGSTVLYLDGEETASSDAVRGDFFHFRNLRFGVGGGGWAGALEGIGIWNRVLSPAEVAEDALRYRSLLARRPAVQRWVVEAVAGARSRTPTLQEISPYRQALGVVEYEVRRQLEGEALPARLRVAEWTILDAKPAPRPPAGPVRLVLERFADNPQLEPLYLSDTLPAAEGPLFHRVRR